MPSTHCPDSAKEERGAEKADILSSGSMIEEFVDKNN
jgi:hypothetical protein